MATSFEYVVGRLSGSQVITELDTEEPEEKVEEPTNQNVLSDAL